MKLNPFVQTVVTIMGVVIVWKLASPMLAKIPVVGKYLAI